MYMYNVHCIHVHTHVIHVILYDHASQIVKKEVDKLRKGKRIPSCQLVARCIKTEQPTTLEHLVTLSGAKRPHHTFTIYRPYDSGTCT
jgi:hypothetical protein